MEQKVREVVKKVYGPEYGNARAVKVSSDGAGRLRKVASVMGGAYTEALERAIQEKTVRVNLTKEEIAHMAAKLTEGMVYISEEHDYRVDWLSEGDGDPSGETSGSSDDDEIAGQVDWLAGEL